MTGSRLWAPGGFTVRTRMSPTSASTVIHFLAVDGDGGSVTDSQVRVGSIGSRSSRERLGRIAVGRAKEDQGRCGWSTDRREHARGAPAQAAAEISAVQWFLAVPALSLSRM